MLLYAAGCLLVGLFSFTRALRATKRGDHGQAQLWWILSGGAAAVGLVCIVVA